ncbi:6665_t:CDS:2 [Acaulospora morrowiae]|uniref:6665_t:CDS:1 n=1 Tax=Acaulospora morrowiae TaxID=94023 RepID=A0A9N9I1N6_9GLOM|nr:6665_t:CDS:2 [Acaulospora morrowiae]
MNSKNPPPEKRRVRSTNASVLSSKPTVISIPTSEEVRARLPKHPVLEHASQPTKQILPPAPIPGAMVFSYATLGLEQYGQTSLDSAPEKLAPDLQAYRKLVKICKRPRIESKECNNVTRGCPSISACSFPNFKAAFVKKWGLENGENDDDSSSHERMPGDSPPECQLNTLMCEEWWIKRGHTESFMDDEHSHMDAREMRKPPKKLKNLLHETQNDSTIQTPKSSTLNNDQETENIIHPSEGRQSHQASSSDDLCANDKEGVVTTDPKFTLRRRDLNYSHKEARSRITPNMDFIERLKILAPQAAAIYNDLEIVEESRDTDQVNTGRMKTHNNQKWQTEETEEFYKLVALLGSDYNKIADLTGRSVLQIRKKFKKEQKISPERLHDAITKKKEFLIYKDLSKSFATRRE